VGVAGSEPEDVLNGEPGVRAGHDGKLPTRGIPNFERSKPEA
jgi:hypothetical protein